MIYPRKSAPPDEQQESVHGDSESAGTEEAQNSNLQGETVTLEIQHDGNVIARSHLCDYLSRGDALEGQRDKQGSDVAVEADLVQRRRPGRPRSVRSRYRDDHPKSDTRLRVIRPDGHHTLPNIIGGYFPPEKDPARRDLFYASMLALLKPWRAASDLKPAGSTWTDAFESWERTAPRWSERERDECAGWMSGTAAADRGYERQDAMEEAGSESIETVSFRVTEEDVSRAKAAAENGREELHAGTAMVAAVEAGLFPSTTDSC